MWVETQFLILVATVERRSEPNFLMPRGTLRPSFLLANFELARALFVLTAEKTRSSGRLHQMRDATIGSRAYTITPLSVRPDIRVEGTQYTGNGVNKCLNAASPHTCTYMHQIRATYRSWLDYS